MKHPAKYHARRWGFSALRGLTILLLSAAHIAAMTLLAYYLRGYAICVYVPLELAAVAAVLHIQAAAPRRKLGWTILILAMPLAGLILYPLWMQKDPDEELLPAEAPANNTPDRRRAQLDGERLSELLPQCLRTETLLSKNGFLLYRDTEVTWFTSELTLFADALERISGAERFVFLETPSLSRSKNTEHLTEALDRAARRGVEVRIITDGSGSGSWLDDEKRQWLQSRGIELKTVGTGTHTFLRHRPACRDCRRLLCIDGQWGYTGSFDWGRPAGSSQRKFMDDREAALLLDGLGVWGLTAQFIHMWEKLDGRLANEDDYYRPLDPRSSPGWCQPFTDGPDDGVGLTEDLYLQCAAGAQEYLWLSTSRLDPGSALAKALTTASDGGVDVRIILPGQWDSRKELQLARTYFRQLLGHGVRIYLCDSGKLHSKVLLADSQFAMVGTSDIALSDFRDHHTSGVMLYGVPMIQDIRRDLSALMEDCSTVDPKAWRKRSAFNTFRDKLIRALQ